MLAGNVFCVIELLINEANGMLSSLCAMRKILPGMLSYPVAFLISMDFNFLFTISEDTV